MNKNEFVVGGKVTVKSAIGIMKNCINDQVLLHFDGVGETWMPMSDVVVLVKWKSEYLYSIKQMTNEQVFDEYSEALPGDDYEGCFTDAGRWKCDRVTEELTARLMECGFLK